jgi:hypothetical protein
MNTSATGYLKATWIAKMRGVALGCYLAIKGYELKFKSNVRNTTQKY